MALQHIALADLDAVYHFRSFFGSLGAGKDLLVSILRDATKHLEDFTGAIVLTGEGVELPPSIKQIAAYVTLPGPTDDEFRELLTQITRDLSRRQDVDVTLTADERSQLVRHLSGLTLMEAEKILTKAIVEDGALGVADIEHVMEAKRRVVEREGLLEYYPAETTMAGVADLVTLKRWLAKRRAVVNEPERADACKTQHQT